jgi:hypothetical protein
MIGNMQGSHVTERGGRESSYRGERLHNPERNFQPTPFGNEIAARTTCGAGGSRTLYGQSGSQGTHGATNPGSPVPNAQRDALDNE